MLPSQQQQGIPTVTIQFDTEPDSSDDAREEEQSAKKSHKSQNTVHGYLSLLRTRPYILAVAFTVLTVLLVAGIVGVVYAARASERNAKQLVYNGPCLQLAVGIRQKMYSIFWGVKAMVSYIRMNPNCSVLNETFMDMSRDIKTWDVDKNIMFLEADPSSVVTYLEPEVTDPELADWLYGYNILKLSPENWLGSSVVTSPGHLLFDGPYFQPDGYFGGYAVYGIFLPAEGPDQDMGCRADVGEPYNCSSCWDPVRKLKFWGFVQGQINLQGLHDGSDPLLMTVAETYHYDLHMAWDLPKTDHNYMFLSGYQKGQIHSTDPAPVDPVKRDIMIENIHWVIEMAPINGWTPSWYGGCIAVVVVGSVTVTVLLAWLLLTMEMQRLSNTRLADSNQRLAETNQQLADTTHILEQEKLATEELVKRQLKLIACLETPGDGMSSGQNTGVFDSGTSFGQGVDARIEAVRRAIKSKNPRGASGGKDEADDGDIKVLEMLGEGTFGKVYKGIWHHTFVAVKSILLPANMSGQAKREKMAIMEAAISSSLSHPNIVQTYTYDIMRHKGSDVSASFATEDSNLALENMVMGAVSSAMSGKHHVQASPDSRMSTTAVHSYEVRIVLEFCDRGSLRDALDMNIFMQGGLFNYCAVLDTVLDISRAILHLHKANVLHGDLKTVNVLLKSSGGEGRGFVAKVADFGLSVQIDKTQTHMSNMFQGTMTHMSPELLLMGQTSRQADVYAFGITMWEVMTGGQPFKGMPLISLGHNIALQGLRPQWPLAVPLKYRLLAESCWAHAPENRPTMEEVVTALGDMRAEAGGPTPAIDMSYHQEVVDKKRAAAALQRDHPKTLDFDVGAFATSNSGNNAAARIRSLSSGGSGDSGLLGSAFKCFDADSGCSVAPPVGMFRLGSKLEEVPEVEEEGEEEEDKQQQGRRQGQQQGQRWHHHGQRQR